MFNSKTIRYTSESTETDLVFNVQLPGERKENVDLVVENDRLVIKLKNKESYNLYYYFTDYDERTHDLDGVTASMEHGLLTVKIPLHKKVKRQVRIS